MFGKLQQYVFPTMTWSTKEKAFCVEALQEFCFLGVTLKLELISIYSKNNCLLLLKNHVLTKFINAKPLVISVEHGNKAFVLKS